MDGYRYTWEGAGTYDGTIKANQPTRFPFVAHTANYRNYLIAHGVNLTGVMATANWYLPSCGEAALMVENLGFGEKDYTNPGYLSYKWASTAFNLGISEVGGQAPGISWMNLSTEWKGKGSWNYMGSFGLFGGNVPITTFSLFGGFKDTRAFVKY